MVGLSPAGEAAILTPLITGAYVSLHTADPGGAGANEIPNSDYARLGPIAFASNGAEPTIASNTAILSFPTALTAWGTVGFFGLWTALTGGTFQGSGALTAPSTIGIGDTVRFVNGALTITVD
jgi:hypothetical protein